MKFHVPALCIAGVLATSIAAAADHQKGHYGSQGMSSDKHSYTTHEKHSRYFQLAGEPLYYRMHLYTDLPTEREVASKLQEMISKQRTEIAHLNAFGSRSRTVGFENVAVVYDHMASDHQRLVDFASNWLRERDFEVPTTADVEPASDMAPHDTVHHMIDMHVKSFNETMDKIRSEESSTVRGTMLMAAATTARHISLLRHLDRDVETGRKDVTAFLRYQMGHPEVASNEFTTRIHEEETIYFQRFIPPLETTDRVVFQQPQIIEQVVEVQVPVETERVVERIVEKPVYVERIVERPAPAPVITQQPTRSRVAGQRQTTRRTRRPAK